MQRSLVVAFLLLICALGAAAQNATNCSSVPPPCGWNAQCNETESGPECSCEIGYQLNSSNDCEMCPWGTWGWNCSYECNCTNIDSNTTCDHMNGTCPEDDTITCYDDPCGENALCQHVNETFECYCPAGYEPVNDTYDCQECSWNTWGVDCAGSCNCTDNSTTCNPVTGLCPEDELNCASSPCGAGALCMDLAGLGEYRCYCTNGSILVNDYWCMKCPAGTWGANCTNDCSCGTGNGCDNINGDCMCNSCYDGTTCSESLGADCVHDFLRVTDKCEDTLSEMFGGALYPEEPDDTLTDLAVELMALDNAVVIEGDPEFDGFSRESVGQGPLVKLTWTVDKTADRPNAEAGLDRLADQVKLGVIRSTLIINSQEATAEVTINSGVRRCEDGSN